MNKNINFVDSLSELCRDFSQVLERMHHVPGMYDDTVRKYSLLCDLIPEQLRDGLIKIAVVGSIKSGKSTFINSLLGSDLLKRGAGVVTSVITRIRNGDRLKATLFFKSWDEINGEIRKALILIPQSQEKNSLGGDIHSFDLRRKSDRLFLQGVRSSLINSGNVTVEKLSEYGLRPELVLISNVLDGYEEVREFVTADSSDPDSSLVEFAEELFFEHKRFTGVAANACYVKDVLIEIPIDSDRKSILESSIEIADCQGSDSVDTSHMLRIQEYLLSANMLVYIISSRSGLREADLKFLRIIRNTGIINNIFFILNVDLAEHDSIESLHRLENMVERELSYLIASPRLYTFSALLNLFSLLEARAGAKTAGNSTPSFLRNIPKRDLARLREWKKEKDLVEYCIAMSTRFETSLSSRIESESLSLMLENHIERLRVAVSGVRKRSSMFLALTSDDIDKVADACSRLDSLKAQRLEMESLVDDSIVKVLSRIRQDFISSVGSFFDTKKGKDASSLREFIAGSSVYSDRYKEMASVSGFNHAMYCMFQDFRNEVDLFMARAFNPSVIEMIKEQEMVIEKEFQSIYMRNSMAPYRLYSDCMQGAACDDIEIGSDGRAAALSGSSRRSDTVDLDGARRILGLSMPSVRFAVSYSAGIKLDAMARFSFYSFMGIVGKLFRSKSYMESGARALKESAKHIRKGVLRSVTMHLETYRIHVLDCYLSPLLNAVARDFREKLIDLFGICAVESEHVDRLISEDRDVNMGRFSHIQLIVEDMERVADRINDIYIKALS